MTRAKIRVSSAANDDLFAIARFTEKHWGRAQRDVYLTKLEQAFGALSENPLLGADCSGIRSGYRKFPVGRHVVFYRIIASSVIEVIRILHADMDVDIQF